MPFLTSGLESKIDKNLTNHLTETSIIINASNITIWNNLHAVPNLSKYTKTSFINRIGIPKPVKSNYDSIQNIRLGYFDNGMILSEKVIEENYGRKLSFSIDLNKSTIKNSPTIENVIKEKSIHFDKISYELISINSNQTLVKLSCEYNLKTNLPVYGDFLAKQILLDFEENLLHALKNNLEKN